MSIRVGYWSDLSAIKLNDQRQSWVHAARPGKYQHPVHGELNFTFDMLRQLSDSVEKKVRGIDIDIDYDHKADVAQGGKAAGWVRGTKVDNEGLWLLVEWTEAAAASIKSKEYKYFSPEFVDSWTDAQGTKHENVLFGGGITNRPFLKDLLPVNLSELSFNQPSVDDGDNDPEGVDVKLSEYAKLVGLPETATEAEVTAKLSELAAAAAKPPAPTPPAPALTMPESIKKLAEENPLVGNLVKLYEAQAQQNATNAKLLREQAVAFKLSELDGAKIALAPTLRNEIKDLALAMPLELTEKFWGVVKRLQEGSGALVQLGEIGGAHITNAEAPDAIMRFNELVLAAVASGEAANPIDAYAVVAAKDPQVYKAYTQASSIKDI
jgi:hypothetical protein